jgi:hypothetical protein
MVFSSHLRSLVEHTLRSFQVSGLIVAVTEQSAAPSYLIAGADAAGVPLREDSLFPVASSQNSPSRLQCYAWRTQASCPGVIHLLAIFLKRLQPKRA